MLFRKRDPRSLGAAGAGSSAPWARTWKLGSSCRIDLGGAPVASPDSSTSPPARSIQLPNMAGDAAQNPSSTQPYGVDMTAALSGQAAGYSVTDVGDLLGNGYDDFVVGAPGVTTPGGTTSQNAVVYLIFGSVTTNGNTISDWLNINANFGNTGIGRVGSLNQARQPADRDEPQTDPINGLSTYNGVQVAYPFAGVKFISSASTTSEARGDGRRRGRCGWPERLRHRGPGFK